MSTTKVNGHNVLVTLGTTPVLAQVDAQQDCTITINNGLIEKAATANGTAREYLAGLYDWNIQVSGLYILSSHFSIVSHLLAGTLLYIGFQIGNETLTGTAYISSFSANGPLRGKTTYNITLQGSGALATS